MLPSLVLRLASTVPIQQISAFTDSTTSNMSIIPTQHRQCQTGPKIGRSKPAWLKERTPVMRRGQMSGLYGLHTSNLQMTSLILFIISVRMSSWVRFTILRFENF